MKSPRHSSFVKDCGYCKDLGMPCINDEPHHVCACPQCGLALEVPCAGEVVADVKVADIAWDDEG